MGLLFESHTEKFTMLKWVVQWFLAIHTVVLSSVLIPGSFHGPAPNEQLLPAAALPAAGSHSLSSVSGFTCLDISCV